MLGDAVIVRKDRPTTDVATLTDHRIADVGQVGYFRAVGDLGRLGLHKGTELDPASDVRSRAQMRVRTDHAVRSDHRIGRGGAADRGTGPDHRVGEGAVGTDHGCDGHPGAPVQERVRQQCRVRLDGDVDVDPGGGGIQHGGARPHHRGHDPVPHDDPGRGELDPVVHTQRLARIVERIRGYGVAMREKRADDVGQVFFTLGIVGRQRCQRLDQRTGRKDVYPGIDLTNGRGDAVGVRLLDNRPDFT